MMLVIDTRSRAAWLALLAAGRLHAEERLTLTRPDALLGKLRHFLSRHHVSMSRLASITVVRGPGIFSYVRVGVVSANALGFAIGVPVRGLRVTGAHEPVSLTDLRRARQHTPGTIRPYYGRKPSITLKGKRA